MTALNGFTFNSIHSDTYSLVAKTSRALLPALRKKEVVIPGKHGSYNFTENTYENRIIEVSIKFVGASLSALRSSARSIAAWLSSTGDYKNLIFDDENTKYYKAKLYSEVGLQTLIRTGEASLLFECEPFAYSTAESNFSVSITENNQQFTITSNGTIETPQVITITNTGSTTITGFSLTRSESS